MVSGHGKTRAYLHRFKLLESATCPCNKGDQTTDHLLYHCTLLQQQREILEKDTLEHGIWPISKHDLITKHLNSFMKFTNSIDFDKLQRWRCNCKVLRDIIQWLYIVKGMQRPTPRAEADPASSTYNQESIASHVIVCSVTSGWWSMLNK
jgi:hypothetical protein